MSDKLLIKLEIIPGMRKFPLNIDPAEEQTVREAAQLVRHKFNLYRRRYAANEVSDLDIIAMVALDIATAKQTLSRENEVFPLKERVNRMNDKLKEYLNIQK
jgi:hypothetical protein